MIDENAAIEAGIASLDLPPDAAEFLLLVWRIIQAVDDVCYSDIGQVDAEELSLDVLLRLPTDPFTRRCPGVFPVIHTQIVKWKAANEAERSSVTSDAFPHKSYMWRAGYYDLVAYVCAVCGKDTTAALNLYGETLDEYRKEFPCQTQ